MAAVILALAGAQPPKAEKAKPKIYLIEPEVNMLKVTNEERAKQKLPALILNAELMKAARDHSANMAKQNKLEHVLDEKTLEDRLKALKYDFSVTAENIAMGQRSGAEAVTSWMKSPPHKANIMNDQYTEMGLGRAADDKGRYYWTQVFAKPAERP
jgi:uncharacterized protein YkwD